MKGTPNTDIRSTVSHMAYASTISMSNIGIGVACLSGESLHAFGTVVGSLTMLLGIAVLLTALVSMVNNSLSWFTTTNPIR